MNIIRTDIAFLIVVAIITAFGIGRYVESNSRFIATCDKINAVHKEMCSEIPNAIQVFHKDSIEINTGNLEAIINSGNSRIQYMLELQHAEIQEDFSNLAIWASALMIIFLIFSIYAMYRADDMVAQGRHAADRIADLAERAEPRVRDLNQRLTQMFADFQTRSNAELAQLRAQSDTQIEQLNKQIAERIEESENTIAEDIKRYDEAVSSKAENVTKQLNDMETFVSVFRSLFQAPPSDKPNQSGDDENPDAEDENE